jgi:Mg2+ and Co2+ transporter CorA
MYLTRSLVDTYGASHRMMEGWMSSWEAAFYKSLCSEQKPRRLKEAAIEISNMLSMVGEFRRRLTAFEHARWTTTDCSWFPDLTGQQREILNEPDQSEEVTWLVQDISSAGKKFEQLTCDIRADMDLLMLQSAAVQQELTERLQKYLGKVTGLVLVPTLVAGLFGANTRLPGGGSWLGFEIMLGLMVLSGVVVYWLIHKLIEDRDGV